MDIYESIFVTYDENGVISWYSTDVFSNYNKAKKHVDLCVDANLKINENTRALLEFGMTAFNQYGSYAGYSDGSAFLTNKQEVKKGIESFGFDTTDLNL